MLRSLLYSFARRGRGSQRKPAARRILAVERLEERSLLTAMPTLTNVSVTTVAVTPASTSLSVTTGTTNPGGTNVGTAPTFALTGPTAGTFVAGQSVTIQWTAANVDVAGSSKISLGYDPDATPFDANQQWITVNGVTAANGAASYSWNTTAVAAGTYHLSGYMYDFSTGKAVFSNLGTSIVITEFALTGPTSGTFFAGQSVTIGWTAGGLDGDVLLDSKISLGYDPDITPFDANQHWIEINQITSFGGAATYSWNTTGVAAGTYYLSGYLYESVPGQAVFSNLDTPIVIVGPPAFTLTGPSTGTFTAGQSITIQWTAANVDVAGPTKISLGYDPDATPFDANQQWFTINGITAANGTGAYSWNTTGLASGTYYLSGYLYDFSTSEAVFSNLGTSIVIVASPAFSLNGPSTGTFTAGQTVTIQWTTPPILPDIVGPEGPPRISLGYDPDATPFDANQRWIEINQVTELPGGGSYAWNTTGVASGTYYLSGYLYDFLTDQAVFSNLGTPIVIVGPPAFTLTGPSTGTFTAGQSVTIQWTAANVDVAGPTKISLGYDPDATPFDANQQWVTINGITAANGAASYSWNTTGVDAGTYYLSGYMYDFSTSEAVFSNLGTSIVIT